MSNAWTPQAPLDFGTRRRSQGVATSPTPADRQVWSGRWAAKGGERHYPVPIKPRSRFCLVCGGRNADLTLHRRKSKTRKPVS